MSMIVVFVPCINKSLLEKRMASVCSDLVDDVSNVISRIFVAHFPDFMKKIIWSEKAKIENLVKGLNEFPQKLDVVSAVIFTLIDVKSESESRQQQPYYFCYNHFLDSGWTFFGGVI